MTHDDEESKKNDGRTACARIFASLRPLVLSPQMTTNLVRAAALALLQETSLAEYLSRRPPSHPVTLNESSSVGEALCTLSRHRILSAPVLSAANGDVLGFFSAQDALAAFVKDISPNLLRGTADLDSRADELASAGAEFCSASLRSVAFGGDGALAYATRKSSASMLDVVSRLSPIFLDDARCNHRMAVWDLDGVDAYGDDAMRVVSVVSQSDVTRFLAKHADQLPGIDALTVQDVGLACKPVLTVSTNTAVLAAFALLAREKRGAIGVTDESGALVANLSASDLRGLTPARARWSLLALSVREFLIAQHGQELPAPPVMLESPSPASATVSVGIARQREAEEAGKYVAVVTVQPTTLLSAVLLALSQFGIHQLYVTDAENKPVSIVTHTDLFRVRRLRCQPRARD